MYMYVNFTTNTTFSLELINVKFKNKAHTWMRYSEKGTDKMMICFKLWVDLTLYTTLINKQSTFFIISKIKV